MGVDILDILDNTQHFQLMQSPSVAAYSVRPQSHVAAVPWQMYELYGVSKEGKASNGKLKDQICVSLVIARVRIVTFLLLP